MVEFGEGMSQGLKPVLKLGRNARTKVRAYLRSDVSALRSGVSALRSDVWALRSGVSALGSGVSAASEFRPQFFK
jgi:hypothetical protein